MTCFFTFYHCLLVLVASIWLTYLKQWYVACRLFFVYLFLTNQAPSPSQAQLSETDIQVSRSWISRLLSSHTVYDTLPMSSKVCQLCLYIDRCHTPSCDLTMYFMVIFTDDLQVVIIDAQMPVKKAFQIMYEEVSLQFLIFLFFFVLFFSFRFPLNTLWNCIYQWLKNRKLKSNLLVWFTSYTFCCSVPVTKMIMIMLLLVYNNSQNDSDDFIIMDVLILL